jgi:cell division protein FtsB
VIAPQRIVQEPPRRVERSRIATKRRARHARRRSHAPVAAVLAVVVAVLLPLMGYVALCANVTSLSFALARTEHERNTLVDETQRLDDRIARLESPDRLAALAATLHLHDPHVYAVVRLPAPKVQPSPSGLAFFGWISGH